MEDTNCKKKKKLKENSNTTYIIGIGIFLDRISKIQYSEK